MRRWIGLVLALGLLWATGAWAGMIGPRLQGILSTASPDQKIPVNIALKQQADNAALEKGCVGKSKEGRWAYVVSELKRLSEVTQRDLLSSLAAQEAMGQVSRVSPLWIVNAVGCDATPGAIQSLAARSEVWYVEYDRVGATLNAEKGTPSDPPGVSSTEPNVRVVGADSVWNLLGYNGDNVIVGEVDTGIRYTHLDLVGHMWNSSVYPNHGFNFASNQFTRGGNVGPSPYDSLTPLDYYGHGSHCAGIVSGDGAYGNGVRDTVGIAPKARMMSVPVDVYLHTPYPDTAMENETMEGMQFCVSPTRDPSNHAQVITMSLGLVASWLPVRALWRQAETNIMTAGIVHCVAAGNEGPTARSIRTPGDVPGPWHHPSDGTGGQSGVISIGATDNSDNAASFTSIGPADWGSVPPYNDYVYPPGLNRPDVAAPGVNIFSTYNTNDQSYTTMSGTSMATPCAAGVVALMLDKNPTLLPWQVDSILQRSVRPLGTQPKNNTFGTGRISAYQAVLNTPFAYSQFMLAAVAADTISPTAAKTDSVTVSSMSSFNFPVTMTLDSIRPATGTIAVAFNPNPVTPPPNGSIKTGMRITTTATPQNNYVLYYHGTGDTITRRATLNLWVTAPTFVLQSTPRTRTVFLGDSTTYADSVISISGYTNPCTLSATVNPPAPSITVSFLPDNVVIPTGGRTMKVRTTGQTPAGTFIITAQARNGGTVRTVEDTLIVRYPVQGPDPYGYYAYDNTDAIFENAPTYSWIELNPARGGNGTAGPQGDDANMLLAAGIRARAYGTHANNITMCTNGFVAINTAAVGSPYTNAALPSTSFVANGVAAFWDDLTVSGTGTSWYRSDANQRFICEWDSVPTLGGQYAGAFEIIVYDTSLTPGTATTRDCEVVLQWRNVGSLASMTVGQQNMALNVGLNCFNNGTYDPMMAPITAGRATKFTTDPPRLRSGVDLGPVFSNLPLRFALGPAVPNPSKGNVGISFDLPVETQVSLKVYNLSGQLVKTLVAGKEKAGYKHVSWDGRSENGTRTASGVYFYRLEAGSFAATKKLVVVR